MDVRIEPSWRQALTEEFRKPYFAELTKVVKCAYQEGTVYPPPRQIFAAFDLCPLNTVRVVILGQDPYHGPGQANGLAFSVSPNIPIPPSLLNIYKERTADVGIPIPKSGDLTSWAKNGVLLLNTSLTVQGGAPGSHTGYGWQTFTDAVITTVATTREHVVFLLWGKHAIAKRELIDESRHCVLTAPHPSPLSAYNGFFGCNHFSKTNEYLVAHGITPILW